MDSSSDKDLLERTGWKTRSAFYFAIICSSFGLVNIWRFPYLVIENGGGAFLYLYFATTFFLGTALVIAELLIGKLGRKSLWQGLDRWIKDKESLKGHVTVFEKRKHFLFRRVGEGVLLANVLVLGYYSAISGWLLIYLFRTMYQVIPETLSGIPLFSGFEQNFTIQLGCGLAHLGLCLVFVRRGLNKGLERVALFAAPVFALILGFLCMEALELPGTEESLRFLLYPDFSKLGWWSLNQAVGHTVLSLSLGVGSMVTFGSFFPEKRDVTSAGPKVVVFSLLLSIASVIVICPLVLSSNYAVFGPKLLFQTLPQLFMEFDQTGVLIALFYVSLYLSSFVVCVGLLESLVTNGMDRLMWSRGKAVAVGALLSAVAMLFPLLSTTFFRHFRWFGGVSLLQSADGLLINYVLPILAMLVSLVAVFVIPNKFVRNEFFSRDIQQEIDHFYPIWRFVVVWLSPAVIVVSIVIRVFVD